MKILTLADTESKYLWDYFEKDKLKGIDLIISCGDLAPQYLSFLATFAPAPVLYVHGNHDDCYHMTPPDGCICIDGSIYNFRGVRILGLGGSIRYKQGTHQYTQGEMNRRVVRLAPKLLYYGGIDILVTHAPAAGINDGGDYAHQGFEAFGRLLDTCHPSYFIHGHVHANYGREFRRQMDYGYTTIVNAYERYVVDYVDRPWAPGMEESRKGEIK
jgi:Icc-related predicted phosphoesterase